MTDMKKFFTALSERAYKENDLSDVTYAMCESDICFKQFFLDFFFNKDNLDASSTSIEREHSTDWGRPDFWIRTNHGKLYIVEVKIWDGSHHFEQYYDILAGKDVHKRGAVNSGNREDGAVWKRLGYIANYDSVKQIIMPGNGKMAVELCRVATWKEFVNKLEMYQCFGSPAVSAYVEYVRRVCPYDAFEVCDDWRICPNDFKKVRLFDMYAESAIEGLKDMMVEPYFGSPRYFKSQYRMGRFFRWNRKSETGADAPQWGWVGAYYTSQGAYICVEFEDRQGWGDAVCEKYKGKVNNGFLRIYATDSERIDGDEKIEEFVKVFLRDTLKFLADNNDQPDNIAFDEPKEEKRSRSLLAMKCLPFALENYLINKILVQRLSECGYEIALEYVNDQEVPNSHCGRYFRLKKKSDADGESSNKQSPSYQGWIGVVYTDNCKKINGPTYGEEPKFELEIRANAIKCPDGWGGNNWGWWCSEVDISGSWRDSLKNAQEKIIELAGCIKSNVTDSN